MIYKKGQLVRFNDSAYVCSNCGSNPFEKTFHREEFGDFGIIIDMETDVKSLNEKDDNFYRVYIQSIGIIAEFWSSEFDEA